MLACILLLQTVGLPQKLKLPQLIIVYRYAAVCTITKKKNSKEKFKSKNRIE